MVNGYCHLVRGWDCESGCVCQKVVDRIGMPALGGEIVRLVVFDKMMYYSLIT